MKKVISTLAATVLTATVLCPIQVGAAEEPVRDAISYTTEILSESIIVDGTFIPSGATAVTVSIDNNSGFNNSSTKLSIGNAYNVILSDDYKPAITYGSVVDDFHVSAFENNNCVAVSVASADYSFDDGDIFTIYVTNSNTGFDDSIVIDDIDDIEADGINAIGYAVCGDTDANGNVNAADATDVYSAVNTYKTLNPSDPNVNYFTVFTCSLALSTFLPYAQCAGVADTNGDGLIQNIDGDYILDFYNWLLTGGNYTNFPDPSNHCGEPVLYYY